MLGPAPNRNKAESVSKPGKGAKAQAPFGRRTKQRLGRRVCAKERQILVDCGRLRNGTQLNPDPIADSPRTWTNCV